MLTASNSLTNTSKNDNDIEHESSEDEDSVDESSQESSHGVHAQLEEVLKFLSFKLEF